jgi:hypothetical protein
MIERSCGEQAIVDDLAGAIIPQPSFSALEPLLHSLSI